MCRYTCTVNVDMYGRIRVCEFEKIDNFTWMYIPVSRITRLLNNPLFRALVTILRIFEKRENVFVYSMLKEP